MHVPAVYEDEQSQVGTRTEEYLGYESTSWEKKNDDKKGCHEKESKREKDVSDVLVLKDR